MNWSVIGSGIAIIAAGLGLYAFGHFYGDSTLENFSYAVIGGAVIYLGGFMHGTTQGK